MPHTIITAAPIPLHRDRGVWAAAAWVLLIVMFNLAASGPAGQVTGLAVATPFLAAALVDRAARVIYVGVATVVIIALVSSYNEIPWDASQRVRIGACVLATAFGYSIAVVRLRARRQTVGITEVSRAVQNAVMCLDAPSTSRASIALRYRAADVGALIGGDALEVVETKWGIRILVADARGKGLGSLRASTLALGTFREWAHEEADLGDLLDRLHRSLDRELAQDEFVTALVGQLDDLCFTFASAGHPFPLLVRQSVATELDNVVTTPPLAMDVPRRPATTGSLRLMAGDVVLMVTDGLIEARDRNRNFFPFELSAIESFSGSEVEVSVDLLLEAAAAHSGGRVTDDIAIAAIRIDDGHRAPQQQAPAPTPDLEHAALPQR